MFEFPSTLLVTLPYTQLGRAVPAVKTQQKDKLLTILYFNLNENDLTISKGQLVSHGLMCLVQKSSKPIVNVLKPSTHDPAVTAKLWKDLKLDENEVLKKNPKISKLFYSMLNTHQDAFTSNKCSVGKTSWEEFKIELVPGARPVNQREPPPLKENLREQLDKWLKD